MLCVEKTGKRQGKLIVFLKLENEWGSRQFRIGAARSWYLLAAVLPANLRRRLLGA